MVGKQLLCRQDAQVRGELILAGNMPGTDPGLFIDQVHVPGGMFRQEVVIRFHAIGEMNGNRSNGCVIHEKMTL